MSISRFLRERSKYAILQFVFRFVAAAMACWLAVSIQVPIAGAHAELVRSTPSAGERLAESPAVVELLFNERLDAEGMKVSVLDASSRAVAGGVPERFEEGKGIRMALPTLEDGYYTVTYSVISADGHPIGGAYVFTVGNPPKQPAAAELDPHAQVGHQHGETKKYDRTWLLYASRIAYYAGLLAVAGLMFWSLMKGTSPVVREQRERLLAWTSKSLLLATLVYVALHLMELAQDDPISEWARILMETTVGRLYAAAFLLALAAPLLGSLGAVGRLCWAVVFLGIEAWSGHAAAFSPKAYSIGLDFVHLLAASLWAGGLILLLAVWWTERPEAGRFALVFSRWAIGSFLALWVTGILSVLAFLPSLNYLFYTWWGKWLLAKIAVSLLVIVTAFFIRLRLWRGELPQGVLLKTDVGLLAAVVFIVGIFTYQTPLPKNEPLYYHQMGTDMHYTLRITPKAPGDNAFTLKIWLPEKDGVPKEVRLRMLPEGQDDVGYIEVPIQPYHDEELDSFPDFAKYSYQAKGPYLPFAAEWTAEILVTDSQGEELKRETAFRIY